MRGYFWRALRRLLHVFEPNGDDKEEGKMKLYVLKLGKNEYIESYALGNRECSVIDDKYNAEHFHSRLEADWIADRFACDVEEIEVED
jgi:hypothetical protein